MNEVISSIRFLRVKFEKDLILEKFIGVIVVAHV